MKNINLILTAILVFQFSSCSEDPIEEKQLPIRLIQCNQSELNQTIKMSSEEEIEFSNLHVDYLNETTHAITVLNIVLENYDKTLVSLQNQVKEQINIDTTLGLLDGGIFGNKNITTGSSEYRNSKEIETAILNSTLFISSSELALIFNEMSDNADMLMELAIEIEEYYLNTGLDNQNDHDAFEILLDNAVTLVDCIAKQHLSIDKIISDSNSFQFDSSRLEFHFSDWNLLVKDISISILENDAAATISLISQLEEALDRFQISSYNIDSNQTLILNDALEQIYEMITAVKENELDAAAEDCYPDGYIQYKRLLLSYVNHISPGFVGKLNRVTQNHYVNSVKYAALPQHLERLTR